MLAPVGIVIGAAAGKNSQENRRKHMAAFLSPRISVLRILVFFTFFSAMGLLSGCGGYHMITQDPKPPVRAAKSGKATLIIIRPTNWGGHTGSITIGGGHVIPNYLDKKMIGQTKGKCFFVTEVKPGSHYIMAVSQNTAVARLNFEAGKIYILQELLFPSLNPFKNIPRTSLSPMTVADFQKEYKDADFLMYDAKNPGDDMQDQDFQELKRDFEKEVKEDPGRHKDTLQYRGIAKL